MDSKAFECVINLAFNREDKSRLEQAHACIEELQGDFIAQGYIPYRVGIQTMSQIVDEHDPYWQTVRELKRVFDPNNVISPGRYSLL